MAIKDNPKQGLSGGNGNMSKWPMPSPASYTPESAPAKPKSGGQGGQYANKHANTPSLNTSIVSSMKSRY